MNYNLCLKNNLKKLIKYLLLFCCSINTLYANSHTIDLNYQIDGKDFSSYLVKPNKDAKGIIFISTPFSKLAVDRLIKFKVPAFKIGSGECNNYPLIEYIAKFKKPIKTKCCENFFVKKVWKKALK